VFILELDWLGILIFFWFIFKGFKSSNEAKKRYAQRQKKQPLPRDRKTKPDRHVDFPRSEPVWETKPPVKSKPFGKKSESLKEMREEVGNKIEEKDKEIKPDTVKLQDYKLKRPQQDLVIDQKAVVNGMIWAEILGPPRAKKKKIR